MMNKASQVSIQLISLASREWQEDYNRIVIWKRFQSINFPSE